MFQRITIDGLDAITAEIGAGAAASLETGAVLVFPALEFLLCAPERGLVARGQAGGKAKNVSYDPASGELRGTALDGPARDTLAAMMARFGDFATRLVLAVAPGYAPGLTRARTSFRPLEIAGRQSSWRRDDTRLHVDAFPSRPTGGARILRVFANIDQQGEPRRWRVGPDFEAYVERFLPRTRASLFPGAATIMALAGITKSRRTEYDQLMLELHDAAKRDLEWQRDVAAEEILLLPGTCWMVFTDQVPHAAIAGRNALEQTFNVDPAVLASPDRAPAAILSRLRGHNVLRPL